MDLHRTAIAYADSNESSLSDTVRDEGTLDYIAERAGMYGSSIEKAAWLLWSIANYHPFAEGNKRTAWLSMQLALDGGYVRCRDPEGMNAYIRRLASGEVSQEDAERFIESSLAPCGSSDRMDRIIEGQRELLRRLSERGGRMPRTGYEEGTVKDTVYYDNCRVVWRCRGEKQLYGSDFELLQNAEHPEALILQSMDEYAVLIDRREAQRLIRQLTAWLREGDGTLPRDKSIRRHLDLDEDLVRSVLRSAAEKEDVEEILCRRIPGRDGSAFRTIIVVWGRETDYSDMARFLDGCRGIVCYGTGFGSCEYPEELNDTTGYETVYRRGGNNGHERPERGGLWLGGDGYCGWGLCVWEWPIATAGSAVPYPSCAIGPFRRHRHPGPEEVSVPISRDGVRKVMRALQVWLDEGPFPVPPNVGYRRPGMAERQAALGGIIETGRKNDVERILLDGSRNGFDVFVVWGRKTDLRDNTRFIEDSGEIGRNAWIRFCDHLGEDMLPDNEDARTVYRRGGRSGFRPRSRHTGRSPLRRASALIPRHSIRYSVHPDRLLGTAVVAIPLPGPVRDTAPGEVLLLQTVRNGIVHLEDDAGVLSPEDYPLPVRGQRAGQMILDEVRDPAYHLRGDLCAVDRFTDAVEMEIGRTDGVAAVVPVGLLQGIKPLQGRRLVQDLHEPPVEAARARLLVRPPILPLPYRDARRDRVPGDVDVVLPSHLPQPLADIGLLVEPFREQDDEIPVLPFQAYGCSVERRIIEHGLQPEGRSKERDAAADAPGHIPGHRLRHQLVSVAEAEEVANMPLGQPPLVGRRPPMGVVVQCKALDQRHGRPLVHGALR